MAMKYMLDTNIIAYIRNQRPEAVLRHFEKYRPEDLCISVITMAELEYGIYRSTRPDQNRQALLMLLSRIPIIPFDMEAAREYGRIRNDLTKKGTLIGANDLLIAAHACSMGLTLITNNVREFGRVEGLQLENWAD